LAKTKLIVNHSGAGSLLSADGYIHITGALQSTPTTTETNTQVTFQQGGTLSKFAVNVSSNTTTICDFRIRKNAANGNQLVSYGSGETGIKEDLTNTDSVTAGDEINIFADIISGTNINVNNLQTVFDSSTNTYQLLLSGNTPQGQNDNLTRFYSFSVLSSNSTETNTQCEMLTAGTLKHFFVNVTANTHTTANSTFRPRINAGNAGSINVVYAATETGIKEDTANTASVTDADDCNFSVVTDANAGTTTITFTTISIGFETTNSQYQCYIVSSGSAVSFNTTTYATISGQISLGTETLKQTTSRTGNTDLKELLTEVTANTITTSPTTIDYRINVGGNHLQISYAAAETGTKSVTGTIAIVDGDEVNYRVVTPNTSGTITFQQISSLYTPTPSITLPNINYIWNPYKFYIPTWKKDEKLETIRHEENPRYDNWSFIVKRLGSYTPARNLNIYKQYQSKWIADKKWKKIEKQTTQKYEFWENLLKLFRSEIPKPLKVLRIREPVNIPTPKYTMWQNLITLLKNIQKPKPLVVKREPINRPNPRFSAWQSIFAAAIPILDYVWNYYRTYIPAWNRKRKLETIRITPTPKYTFFENLINLLKRPIKTQPRVIRKREPINRPNPRYDAWFTFFAVLTAPIRDYAYEIYHRYLPLWTRKDKLQVIRTPENPKYSNWQFLFNLLAIQKVKPRQLIDKRDPILRPNPKYEQWENLIRLLKIYIVKPIPYISKRDPILRPNPLFTAWEAILQVVVAARIVIKGMKRILRI